MPTELSYKKRIKNIKAKSMLSTACYRWLFRLWKPCGKLSTIRENPVTLLKHWIGLQW